MMSESNGKLVKETVFSYIKESKTGVDTCPDITKNIMKCFTISLAHLLIKI